jgi:hypothetical protein
LLVSERSSSRLRALGWVRVEGDGRGDLGGCARGVERGVEEKGFGHGWLQGTPLPPLLQNIETIGFMGKILIPKELVHGW